MSDAVSPTSGSQRHIVFGWNPEPTPPNALIYEPSQTSVHSQNARNPYTIVQSGLYQPSPIVAGVNILANALPATFELPLIPPTYDQGNIGSCTANVVCNAYRYTLQSQHLDRRPIINPSRLYNYYYARRDTPGMNIRQDNGVSLHRALESAFTHGLCTEAEWPYIDTFAPDGWWEAGDLPAVQPNAAARNSALTRKIRYYSVQRNLVHMKRRLSEGYPILAGLNVYTAHAVVGYARDALWPMPEEGHGHPEYGHAVLIIGYRDNDQPGGGQFKILNSLTAGYNAHEGVCWIPYEYLMYLGANDAKHADEFWTIRLVDDGGEQVVGENGENVYAGGAVAANVDPNNRVVVLNSQNQVVAPVPNP